MAAIIREGRYPHHRYEHRPRGGLNDRKNLNSVLLKILIPSAIHPRPHNCLPVAAVGGKEAGGTRSCRLYDTNLSVFFNRLCNSGFFFTR